MSVLIKGIKMPHSCMGCRFCEHGSINEWDLYCGIDNKHVGNWDDKHINNGWRHPACPLVEVLTPHGRLIDGDNFIKRLSLCKRWAEEDDFALGVAWYETFIRHIELTPTIIEAEEGDPHETD